MKESRKHWAKQYKVTLPAELETKLKMLSRETGKTMSAVIRDCLQSSRPVFRAAVPVTTQQERLRVLRLIAKASNNINQVAHSLNTLNLKNELDYQHAIHYLRLLDTIEARLHHGLSCFEVK